MTSTSPLDHCGASSARVADVLNHFCTCVTLNDARLCAALEADPRLAGLGTRLKDTHPHLFSQSGYFLDAAQLQAIAHAVQTLHEVMNLPGFAQQVLPHAPAIAQPAFGPAGVFMGYDFHLTDSGPKLIEINTNAGGAFLNAALATAHQACCESMAQWVSFAPLQPHPMAAFVAMFKEEWRLQRGDAPWQTVVIVDDDPTHQYLAPEFELARAIFEQQGLHAVIADAGALRWTGEQLLCDGLPVDMVYNRLTDFYLDDPRHAALQQAYIQGAVVLTPHPRAYALTANKSNLIALQDPKVWHELGLSDAQTQVLGQCIPHTEWLTPANSAALWAQRKQLFFKPPTGYGSKAVYRGDKLTQKVWQELIKGGTLAQALVAPSERVVMVDGQAQKLKVDARAYAYQGQVQLLAARTYAGQTTNMRTPGGGFAPIVAVPGQPPAL